MRGRHSVRPIARYLGRFLVLVYCSCWAGVVWYITATRIGETCGAGLPPLAPERLTGLFLGWIGLAAAVEPRSSLARRIFVCFLLYLTLLMVEYSVGVYRTYGPAGLADQVAPWVLLSLYPVLRVLRGRPLLESPWTTRKGEGPRET